MSRLVKILPLLALLLGALVVAPTAPASAVLPVPPGGGCSLTFTHTQKSAKVEVPKVTYRCGGTRKIAAIELHVTFFRRAGGGAPKYHEIAHTETKAGTPTCLNESGATPYGCWISVEMPDPAGNQVFEASVAYEVYYSTRPFCSPNGNTLPECIQDVARGTRQTGTFTS